jgi:hypothetical protein
MRYITVFILFISTHYVAAQIAFQYDQSIPINVDGVDLTMPWTGGMNSVQYNTMDLNHDQVMDLVLFDRTSNKISTYLTVDNHYAYAPDYEAYFPEGLTNWLLLRDYDCDGKKDLFTYNPFGMTAYHNVSNGDQLQWEVAIDPVTTLGTSSVINIKFNGCDIPVIDDLDGDGDLDVLIFGFNGGDIQYHQNFSIERTASCDVPDFERVTDSWGNFADCDCGSFSFDGGDCEQAGGRVEHVGGKSLLAYDMDGDGDVEVVIGDENCSELFLFENRGDLDNARMDGFVKFPNSTDPTMPTTFAAAYLEDINFDGKKDLLVSANLSANTFFNASDFENSSWLYANMGSENVPDFQFSTADFLQSEMLDLGSNSSVAFADEDGDGDLDMLVTSHGQYQQFFGYGSKISLYRNVGTQSAPAFQLDNQDYLGLSGLQLGGMKLYIADVNGDRTMDLVISATSLNTFAYSVFYVLNNSENLLNFNGQQGQPINTPFTSTDNLHFFDVDQDGLTDLLVGKSSGNLVYYNNVGNGESPDYQLQTEEFYNIATSFTNRNLAPTVGDVDGDGEMDLITADDTGQLIIYGDFLNQLEFPLTGVADNYFNVKTETVGTFRLGLHAVPVLVDIYNAGTPVIVIGTAQGGLQLLKNTEARPPQLGEDDKLLRVFPNPGNISSDGVVEISTQEELFVKIISVLGKEIYAAQFISPGANIILSLDQIPSGMYVAVAERDGKVVDEVKFVIAD